MSAHPILWHFTKRKQPNGGTRWKGRGSTRTVTLFRPWCQYGVVKSVKTKHKPQNEHEPLIVTIFIKTLKQQLLLGATYVARDYVCKDWLCDIHLQDCCDCCSLGLQLRSEGHRCEAHQYLGFHCRRVFLTCCEGDESRAVDHGDRHTVRERPALAPTTPPKKGTASKYTHIRTLRQKKKNANSSMLSAKGGDIVGLGLGVNTGALLTWMMQQRKGEREREREREREKECDHVDHRERGSVRPGMFTWCISQV